MRTRGCRTRFGDFASTPRRAGGVKPHGEACPLWLGAHEERSLEMIEPPSRPVDSES